MFTVFLNILEHKTVSCNYILFNIRNSDYTALNDYMVTKWNESGLSKRKELPSIFSWKD
jgi:hypothetical protein